MFISDRLDVVRQPQFLLFLLPKETRRMHLELCVECRIFGIAIIGARQSLHFFVVSSKSGVFFHVLFKKCTFSGPKRYQAIRNVIINHRSREGDEGRHCNSGALRLSSTAVSAKRRRRPCRLGPLTYIFSTFDAMPAF